MMSWRKNQRPFKIKPIRLDIFINLCMVLRGFLSINCDFRSLNGYFKMTNFRFLMAISICIVIHHRICETFLNGTEIEWIEQSRAEQGRFEQKCD